MDAKHTVHPLVRFIRMLLTIAAVSFVIVYAFRAPGFQSQLASHGLSVVQSPSNAMGYPLAVANALTGNVAPSQIVQVNTITATDKGVALCSQMPNLELASLNGLGLTDAGLTHLASCSRLKELSVANTSVDGTGLKHLQHCTFLNRLDLSDTKVNDASVGHIVKLSPVQKLFLSGPLISDRSLPRLLTMPNLSLLYLTKTGVTETACQLLVDANPHIACTLVTDTHIIQLTPNRPSLRVALDTHTK